jgi:Probable zinc-ribbon domain
MSKKRKTQYKDYVMHPRYGNKPLSSGESLSLNDILNAHWRWKYSAESIFPETAILADVSKQNFSTFPIGIYVDIENQCVDCKRWFIFFAQEQRYWFEELGFYVDSTCNRCIECRKKEQVVKRLVIEYENLVNKQDRNELETSNLKQIAMELFQQGYIKNIDKVNKLK